MCLTKVLDNKKLSAFSQKLINYHQIRSALSYINFRMTLYPFVLITDELTIHPDLRKDSFVSSVLTILIIENFQF
jgi:hypothetical protein